MKSYTKNSLIEALRAIREKGWIPNARPGNDGGVGNTLEDELGIPENNLPIPNAAEWELKCQRTTTSSLTTLFHMEPSPRVYKFVPAILLPKYGWRHERAGMGYPDTEMSFRQTLNGVRRTDRGFMAVVDRVRAKVVISFDASGVSPDHAEWLNSVRHRVGPGELDPQPYWGFDDLAHKAGTKLLNCFFVQAESKKIAGIEYLRYSRIQILRRFAPEHLLAAIENDSVLIDFDARTGHNHGTKFRLRQNRLPQLYDEVIEVG
jgi:hypothetical protein